MSWRYSNRKKQNRNNEDDREDFFNGTSPFDFGRFGFQDIDEMIEGMFRTAESLGRSNDPNSIFYGYQVNVGPDGKPQVREFGNVKPTRRGTFELHSREPYVDTVVDEKEQALKVVAEMPGVQKEDIQIQATEDSLSIKAANKDRNYETMVPLSSQVDPSTAKAAYRNGVLEVSLKLKQAAKPKGMNVKVE